MEIRTVTPPANEEWDTYVRNHQERSLFHETAWTRAVMEAFPKHQPCLLEARRDGRLAGVLPLFHVRSLLFGNRLVSPPFGVYGGILADDVEVAQALASAAQNLANDRGAKYVELRSRTPVLPGVPIKDLYWAFRVPIAETYDATLARIATKKRQDLRRTYAKGFRFHEGVETKEFYRFYLHLLRYHGTPPFPLRWFEALRRSLGDRCVVLGVNEPGTNGRRVGATMTFRDSDSLISYYTGIPREFYSLRVTVALNAHLLRMAVEERKKLLDLGRSKVGTGAFDAKAHWGIEPEKLGYQYLLPEGCEMPDLSPSNPKFQPLIAMWKRLPLGATRLLGPALNAQLA